LSIAVSNERNNCNNDVCRRIADESCDYMFARSNNVCAHAAILTCAHVSWLACKPRPQLAEAAATPGYAMNETTATTAFAAALPIVHNDRNNSNNDVCAGVATCPKQWPAHRRLATPAPKAPVIEQTCDMLLHNGIAHA